VPSTGLVGGGRYPELQVVSLPVMCCAISTTLVGCATVGRTVPVPDCDAACPQSLHGAPVEVREDAGIHVTLPQSS